jgi:hypothetical protein
MPSSSTRLSRRILFAGGATAGAVAVAASLLPKAQTVEAAAPVPKAPPPERGGGYALSDHVKQYYKTTRV